MKQIDLSLNRKNSQYQILIDSGLLHESMSILNKLDANKIAIISNEKVASYYLDALLKSINSSNWNGSVETLLIGDGENYKSIESYSLIMDRLIGSEFKRNDLIVVLGGGVIGDLAGFCAATFYRGINFIQIPTSLLAMVDSSVGGKTAINHPAGKNLIGAFHQPMEVRIDTDCLQTLDRQQFSAGMAEIIKIAAIYDKDFFSWLEKNAAKINQLEETYLQQMIFRSCQLKADIVNQDELEKGIRAILNFGHTFGHAIETLLGYGKILHGEAVAIGMVLAARFSQQCDLLSERSVVKLINLLEQFKLPTTLPQGITSSAMISAMMLDKKNQNQNIRLILLTEIGQHQIKEYAANDIELFLQTYEQN